VKDKQRFKCKSCQYQYSQTLSRLLERLAKGKVTVYWTDDWRPYQQLLDEHPDAFHVISKRETTQIIAIGLLDFIAAETDRNFV
jgi:IS1 family transposase